MGAAEGRKYGTGMTRHDANFLWGMYSRFCFRSKIMLSSGATVQHTVVHLISLTRECGWRRDSVRVLRPVAVKPSQAFP
jgi:hypothetical protein